MAQVLGIIGTLATAVVAYVLALSRDRRQKLRDEQIRSSTDFCRLLMDYSGAQLRRRTEELRREPQAAEDETIAQAVRSARANVWSSYFHVMLVVSDPVAIQLARAALERAVSIKRAGVDEADVDVAYRESKALAERVRDDAEVFIAQVARHLHIHPPLVARREQETFA